MVGQRLSDIKMLLTQRGLTPKHRHGQNFLHDQRKMQTILEAAAVVPGGWVLEVGPGTGALTQQLLETGANVLAVEIDGDLEPVLRDQLAVYGDRFRLIMGDILDGKHAINPQVIQAIGALAGDQAKISLVANLPYHVASPLLANLVVDHPQIDRGVVMIQKEVADRLTAGPGSGDYGPLGIMIQAICRVDRVATLPPGCFWPPPQVDSAVVRFVRRDVPLTDDPHRLMRLLHLLFSKRRKQIRAILGKTFELPQEVNPTSRPEQLDIACLVRLSKLLPDETAAL